MTKKKKLNQKEADRLRKAVLKSGIAIKIIAQKAYGNNFRNMQRFMDGEGIFNRTAIKIAEAIGVPLNEIIEPKKKNIKQKPETSTFKKPVDEIQVCVNLTFNISATDIKKLLKNLSLKLIAL
jgi:hypothetical protein